MCYMLDGESHCALHVGWQVTLCYMLDGKSRCITCWMVSHIHGQS